MTEAAKVLPFNGSVKRNAPKLRHEGVVPACRNRVEAALPKLLDGFFEKLDDTLYGFADKSESSELRAPYFDNMRLLRKHRKGVQKRFVNGVLRDFDALWSKGPRNLSPKSLTSPPVENGLSLMEEEDLERSLAMNGMITQGENRFHAELYALTGRFAHVAGDIDLGIHSNPLGPAAICNCFNASIQNLSLDTPVLLVVYKLFDKQVMRRIGALYEELNALLIRADVLPKLAQTRSRPSGRSRSPTQTQGEVSAGAPVQGQLFATLQDLLAHSRVQQGSTAAASATSMSVPTPRLLTALSKLQNPGSAANGSAPGIPVVVDVRMHLSRELELDQDDGALHHALDKEDNDALDVVAMLFEFILEDPNLPDAMKALIARLQIPMLKIAIMDKGFFSLKMHPARRLLNALAQAAMRWSEADGRGENSLYGRIESVVQRVVTGFEDDPYLFKELEEEFSTFLEREERGATILAERANQVAQGKERLQVAKNTAGDEISRRLEAQAQVPSVVRKILEEGWKDLLVLTYLRQGADSEAWQGNLQTMDLLLWSVQPGPNPERRQALLKAIPQLLGKLREGLNNISYDPHRLSQRLKALQACHLSILRGKKRDPSEPAPETPPAREETQPQEVADTNSPTPPQAPHQTPRETGYQDRFMTLADSLTSGTWIELQAEDGTRSRLKLSWKSDVYDHFMFVNRRGVKTLETTLDGVAKLFRNGDATVIEQVDTPIMDRALDSVVDTLKSTASATG